MNKVSLILIILLLAIPCLARVITVDDDGIADFNDIQAAINDANDGDEVVVADGLYTGPGNRDIDFGGKAITVRSENGPTNCIIDCNGTLAEPHRAFIFDSGEGDNSVLRGFTITGGHPGYLERGAGVRCFYSNPVVTNCVFRHNTNSVILFEHTTSAEVVNCTFHNNQRGLIWGTGCSTDSATVRNSIMWDNEPTDRSGIGVADGKCGSLYLRVYYSVLQSDWWNSENCIVANPCFADANNGNYHLRCDSPCIDAGDPNYVPEPNETDIDGEPRVMGDRVDMGVDEYPIHLPGIGVSPKYLEFYANEGGENPEIQILSISNCGAETLNWQIVEDCDWLQLDPNTGSSIGAPNEVTVSVDISGLAAGTYNCSLAVVDPNAVNSPQTVNVSLMVRGPEIGLSATSFNFFADPCDPNLPDQILTISNSGGGTLSWTISYDCNWLYVNPISGSSNGEENYVTLSVDTTGLGEGAYNCELTISDPNAHNSPQIVTVTLIFSADCFFSGHPDYDEWLAVGQPECWCYKYQCHGDADGLKTGNPKSGYFYVTYPDITILVASWERTSGYDICADFSRSLTGCPKCSYYRVSFPDITTLVANWQKTDSEMEALEFCGGNLSP